METVRLCEAERLCEQGDGHLIRQPAAATFPHWGRLLVNANNVTAGCKHTPLRSVASLLRKHCPRPTNVTFDSVHTRENLFPVSKPNCSLIRTPVATYFHFSAG